MATLRQCLHCFGQYPEEFFRRNVLDASSTNRRRHPTCIGCEQTARDKTKRKNRWLVKARDTIRRHAKKYIEKGLALSIEDFCQKFHWELSHISHVLQHAYANGCPDCREKFSDMGHGLADLTLDIIDRDKLPYFGINTRPLCGTCNREKGKTTAEQWGAKQYGWRLWEENQTKLNTDPFHGLPLFARAA